MNKRRRVWFFITFIVLNTLNTFFITTQTLNRYMVPVNYSVVGTINSIIGNVSILLLIYLITQMFTKTEKSKMISLLVITFLLNGFLFAVNVFNRYYASSFTFRSVSILKNPAEGVGMGIAFEAFKELITYYRVVLFIPFIVLLVLAITYMKKEKETVRTRYYGRLNLSTFILFLLLSFANHSIFSSLLKDETVIDSIAATYAGQNLGIYSFHFYESFGINYNNKYEESKLDDVKNNLDIFNKNKPSYKSYVDGLNYEISPKIKDIENVYGKLIEQKDDEDYITGILEDYNLVLIHLETFNHFLLEIDEIGERLGLLKAIMSESYVFDNYYTNVGVGNSFDAEISILSGHHSNGVSNLAWDYNPNNEETNYNIQTIARQFLEKDYDNVWSTHGDTNIFYNRINIHPKVFGFEYYYAKEHFLDWYNHEDYNHDAGAWVSDRALFEFIRKETLRHEKDNEQFMIFGLTMLPHVPYWYDPINDGRIDIFPQWEGEVSPQTIRYLNFMDYYNDIFNYLFKDEYDNLVSPNKTAYVFYGDHGSGINNGDLDVLYDLDEPMSNIELRKKLLHTTSFIYVPGEDEVTVNGNMIKEGLLKGRQELVRSHVDIYRTIVDLFNLPLQTNDYLFSTHGFSTEKTFALDNKSLDIIIDEGIFNLKNNTEYILDGKTLEDIISLREKILLFKKYSDIAITNNLYYKFRNE